MIIMLEWFNTTSVPTVTMKRKKDTYEQTTVYKIINNAYI